MEHKNMTTLTRRGFAKSAAAVAGTAILTRPLRAVSQGNKTLRIGWVGAGERGTVDVEICLQNDANTELVAVADVFQDRIDGALKRLKDRVGDRVKVTPDTTFLGFDGYKKILEMPEVDIVFLTTPPNFRPVMLRETIEAGKHCFAEKPGAVDPVGIRLLLETAELAKKKNLSIVPGMQQRFMGQYHEVIKRVQDGAIGDIRHLGSYWVGTMMDWHYQPRESCKSDLEWQIRAWPHFTWLSGDCCVEQLVHNLDISNWVAGTLPEQVRGLGGRIVRKEPEWGGNVYDHFAFDYDYPGNLKSLGTNAQIGNISSKVCNTVSGSKGFAYMWRNTGFIKSELGDYSYDGSTDGEGPMFRAMCDGIRKGEPVNMCQTLAEATMCAILGRISTYTGRALSWKWGMQSKLDLTPRRALAFEGEFPYDPAPLVGQVNPI